jgi:hypothetical protein
MSINYDLIQHPERYSFDTNTSTWIISADGDIESSSIVRSIPPVTIKVTESDLSLTSDLVNGADNLIIHLQGDGINKEIYSPTLQLTLQTATATTPHYTYKENSSIATKTTSAKMGKTIPILKINADAIERITKEQREIVKNAGVTEVKWETEDNYKGIIKQLGWSLVEGQTPPSAEYSVLDLANVLIADYNISTPTSIKAAGLDPKTNRLDSKALATYINGIEALVKNIETDTNTIKKMYYSRVQPDGVSLPYTVSTTYDPSEGSESDKVLIDSSALRNTTIIKIEPTPAETAGRATDKAVSAVSSSIVDTQTTLDNKITELDASVQAAQSGDAAAQASLQASLDAQNTRTLERLDALASKLPPPTPTTPTA